MAKRLMVILMSLLLVTSIFVNFSFSAAAENVTVNKQENLPVSEKNVGGAVIARFENMLNHNYLYNDDFEDDKTIIENSILALLQYADEGEINKELVLNFIANMYGRQVDDDSCVYDFATPSKGNFLVVPKGYYTVSHKITSAEENDGGYVVFSQMTVDSHDTEEYTVTVKSVFVQNAGSCYGYNLVSSEYFNNTPAA